MCKIDFTITLIMDIKKDVISTIMYAMIPQVFRNIFVTQIQCHLFLNVQQIF
jgi:hypothetical protein